MIDENEEAIVVAVLVEGTDLADVVAGSTKMPCSSCKKEVWVSKTSREIMITKNAKVCCMHCTVEIMKKDPLPTKIAKISELQKDELQKHMWKDRLN